MRKDFPDQRTLIIITGGPGTGKSATAAGFLAYMDNDTIVRISYDEIKEKNWDRFGFDDLSQKKQLNEWGLEEFYLSIRKSMWEGRSILIEYPFFQRHRPRLEELIKESSYSSVTIYLYTDMQTLYEREMKRDDAGDRHPGHLLEQYHIETYQPSMLLTAARIAPTYEEFTDSIAWKDYDISLGLRIPVDVTDFRAIDYADIYERIVAYESKEKL